MKRCVVVTFLLSVLCLVGRAHAAGTAVPESCFSQAPSPQPPGQLSAPLALVLMDRARVPEFANDSQAVKVVAAYVQQACNSDDVRGMIPEICALSSAAGSGELQAALAAETISVLMRSIESSIASLEYAPEMLTAASLLSSAARGGDPCIFGGLLRGMGSTARDPATGLCQAVEPGPNDGPLARAGLAIMWIVAQRENGTPVTEAQADAMLRYFGGAGTSAAEQEAARLLTQAVSASHDVFLQLIALDPQQARVQPEVCLEPLFLGLVQSLTEATTAALVALGDSVARDQIAQSSQVQQVATTLLSWNWESWLDHALELTGSYDPALADTVAAIKLGYRLMTAKTVGDALRLLTGIWPDGLIFDVNLGAVPSEDNNGQFAGDATLGYSFQNLGLVARGGMSAYTLSDEQQIDDTTRMFADGEAWWNTTPSSGSRTRFDVRASGGAALYDTTRTFPEDSENTLLTESSLMARARLLIGVRSEPHARLGLSLLLGGGYQGELYDQFVQQSDGSFTYDDRMSSSGMGEGRARLQFALGGSIVLRLKADALVYRITRAQSLLTADGDDLVLETTKEVATQLEVASRANLDWETPLLFGFVPSLSGGLDYVLFSSKDATIASRTPVFAAGLRRTFF